MDTLTRDLSLDSQARTNPLDAAACRPGNGEGAPAQPEPPFQPEAYARRFRQAHGRAPRVLHIGNIAANAYNNAKMMRALGFECDVLCANYYHMMGCPEWEDADFSGDIGDHFAPDWTRVDLAGFRRPRWFVQGPLELCLRYLIARNRGRPWEADLHWRALSVLNRTSHPTRVAAVSAALYRCREFAGRSCRILGSRVRRERVLARLDDAARRWRDQFARRTALRGEISPFRSLMHGVVGYSLWPVVAVLKPLVASLGARVRRRGPSQWVQTGEPPLVGELCDDFAARFPDRGDRLTPDDVLAYSSDLALWREVFSGYDIVQGYATDPIYPMLAEAPYCAFEHGTLRELPFRADTQGRMTALAYARASHVFVTNSDCMDNARILAGDRASPLPHPFDEDRAVSVTGAEPLRASLQRELGVDHLAFFPTRQDWLEGTGFADKANDRFFRALSTLRREGLRLGVVCCEWGRNVAESRALLRELGLEDCVKWVAPMGVVRYERHVLACDIIVDQFLLGAFGGVTFRALAAGRPVLTWLKEDEVARSFGTCPPILNCRTTDEIAEGLRRVLLEPAELRRIGEAARAWVKRHHSGRDTVTAQLREYARVIDRAAAGAGIRPGETGTGR